MNLQFGMNYVLRYPIKYIHSPYIKLDNRSWYRNSENYYVNKNEAEKIWINKYYEYLATLSYVTIPIVRTVFEINLYNCCEELLKEESDTNKSIEEKMFELLELYEIDNSESVNFDFNSENIEASLLPKIDCIQLKEYIDSATKLKKTVKFNNIGKRDSIVLGKRDSLESKLALKFYPIWFNPKNFQQFWNKIIDENYCDICNEMDMQYYREKIIDAKRRSIIVKYSQKWNK